MHVYGRTPNIVVAPSIEFDRDRRFLIAQGTAAQSVSTVLVQAKLSDMGTGPADKAQPRKALVDGERKAKTGKSEEKPGDTGPVAITSARLTYADAERKAHYEGGVIAKGTGFTVSSSTMDAYLLPRSQPQAINHLQVPGNSTTWWLRTTCWSSNRPAEPRGKTWFTQLLTTNSS